MLRRGLLGYLPVNMVQALAGFGAVVAFTRILSPADYGAYALAFSATSLVHTCCFTWVEAAMARFHATETTPAGRAALFATLYRTFAVIALVAPLITGAVLAVLPLNAPLKFAIGAGLASVVGRSLLKLAQERRRASGEVAGFAAYDMLATGGGFVIGAMLALAGFGAAAPLAGAGAACAVLLVWALPLELRMAAQGTFEPRRLAAYAHYGLPLSLSLVMGLALATTDRFVLAAYLNETAVGAYHAGYSLSNRTLDVLFIWLGMAGGPAAVAALERGGHAALKQTARAQAELMALIAIPAAAGVALVAHPLASLMIGQGLAEDSARVTPWIALSALLSGATTYYFHTAFTLGRRTGRLLLAMAIPAVANLVLALVLIPRFGLMGAVWATTASFGIGLVASALLGRACIALPIPWRTLGEAGLAAGIMALAVSAVPAMGGVVELGLKATLGACVYASVILALDTAGSRGRAGEVVGMLRARLPVKSVSA